MAGRDKKHTESEVRVGWKMAGLGMEVAVQVMVGALLGWWYDKWRGTAPTGVLIGSLLGIAVGLYSMIRGALRLNRMLDRQHPTAGRGKPIPYDDEDEEESDDEQWNRS